MNFELSNPIVLTIGGIILLVLLYFWNKRNTRQQRSRKDRNFRKNYYDRKKEREKESEN